MIKIDLHKETIKLFENLGTIANNFEGTFLRLDAWVYKDKKGECYIIKDSECLSDLWDIEVDAVQYRLKKMPLKHKKDLINALIESISEKTTT